MSSSILIPLLKPDSLYSHVEIYPDEITEEVDEILNPLIAEYAPLKLWKAVALEYHRQGMHEQFLEVLTSVASEIETEEVKQIYKDKGCYKDIVDIYGILAADSVAAQGEDGIPLPPAFKNITTWLNQSEVIDKTNEYVVLVGGFFQILRGQFESADSHFKRIKQKQYIYGATVGQAVSAFQRGRYPAAYELFTKAMGLSSNCGPTVRLAAAACCVHVNKVDRARDLVEAALRTDPTSQEGLVLLSLLDLIASQKSPQKAEEKRQSAHEYFMMVEHIGTRAARGGAVGSACATAMNHLANHAFHAWTTIDRHARGLSSESIGDIGSESNRRMLILSPVASEHVSGGLIASGDLIRVNQAFSSAVEDVISSTDSGGKFQLSIILREALPRDLAASQQLRLELKEVNRAKDLTTRAFRGTSNKNIKAESLYLLGRLHHMLGELPTAYRHYEDALLLVPTLTLAQFAMGKRYLAQKEFPQALEMFEKVNQSTPEDRDTCAYIALIKAIYKQEVLAFDKLKEVAPGFHFEADLWLLQGQLRLRSHSDFNAALKCYQNALAVMKKQNRYVNPLLLSNIAVLQVSLGDPASAVDSSRRCLFDLEAELQATRSAGKTHAFASDIADYKNPILYCHENDVFFSWADVTDVTVDAISLENYLDSPVVVNSTVTRDDNHKFGFSYFRCHGSGTSSVLLAVGDHIIVGGNTLLTVQEVFASQSELYFIGKGMQKYQPTTALSLQKKMPGTNFNEKTATLCYDYALILEEKGYSNAAVEIYQELLKIHPNYTQCFIRLSKNCVSMGKVKAGQKWLQHAMTVAPKDTDVQSAIADIHLSQGDSAKVMKLLVSLCGSKDQRAHVLVGNIIRYGSTVSNFELQLKESYKYYHHVLQHDRRSSYGANGLGIVMAEKSKLDVARDTFTRVREANAPGSDIVNSACVNLAIVYFAQKKNVDAIQLLSSCLRSLASASRPSEACSVCGQIDIGNLLSMVLVNTEYFREAIRVVSKILFLNPTVVHNWYNLAYLREELAVNSLRKLPRSSGVRDAISDLEAARTIFRELGALLPLYDSAKHVSRNCSLINTDAPGSAFSRNFTVASDGLRNIANHLISFDRKLTSQHEVYCEGSIAKAMELLERQLREEEIENSRRNEMSELHQQRVKALELQREQEEQERIARRLEQQEKARQKATEFQRLRESWASMPTASEKKRSGGKKSKSSQAEAGSDDGIEYSDAEGQEGAGGALDNLADSDDNSIASEEEVDFGSDGSSSDGGNANTGDEKERKSKKSKKDKKHKKEKKKSKDKHGKKRARNEEDTGAAGSRLKKRAVMSDEDDGLFDSAPVPAASTQNALFDSDDDNAPPAPTPSSLMEDGTEAVRVNRSSRVIGDDDDDEEWNE